MLKKISQVVKYMCRSGTQFIGTAGVSIVLLGCRFLYLRIRRNNIFPQVNVFNGSIVRWVG